MSPSRVPLIFWNSHFFVKGRKRFHYAKSEYDHFAFFSISKLYTVSAFICFLFDSIGHSFINVWPFKGYSFFSSNLWSKFSQCYCIDTRECHISPESLYRELSKFTHYFDLVAMATLLALWLAKHGNGCNYLTKHRMLAILGW